MILGSICKLSLVYTRIMKIVLTFEICLGISMNYKYQQTCYLRSLKDLKPLQYGVQVSTLKVPLNLISRTLSSHQASSICKSWYASICHFYLRMSLHKSIDKERSSFTVVGQPSEVFLILITEIKFSR